MNLVGTDALVIMQHFWNVLGAAAMRKTTRHHNAAKRRPDTGDAEANRAAKRTKNWMDRLPATASLTHVSSDVLSKLQKGIVEVSSR